MRYWIGAVQNVIPYRQLIRSEGIYPSVFYLCNIKSQIQIQSEWN